MAGDAARTAEEMRFLRAPRAAIGPRAMAAVEAIGRRLDLDYAGLDFAVTADGKALVFEANATMLTHLEPESGPFAAKNPFIQPIIDAFQARLGALAGV
jgi:glutathione synthase/RimK-type ligase-like ATP-grasp enzyme